MSIRLNVIISLYERGAYEDVNSIVEEYLSTKKNVKLDPKILYCHALSLLNVKEYERAISMFTRVLESELNSTFKYQCRILRGYLFTKCNHLLNAKTEFLKLIDDGYESVMIYAALGHISYKLQRKEEAIIFLEKALSIDSDNLNALNTMSYILIEYNMDLERAGKYMEKVLKQDPNNPLYLDTYGFYLLKMKKYVEAKRVLEFAYRYNPHPVILEHINEVTKAKSII